MYYILGFSDRGYKIYVYIGIFLFAWNRFVRKKKFNFYSQLYKYNTVYYVIVTS